MQLALSTWPQVQEYLARSKGCIIPIGSTEQHGPTGPCGTDAICAETVARELGAAVGGLVAPTISVGMSVHHHAFPGSLSLRPSLLQSVVREYIFGLAAMGLERFLFINGHGGNIASLDAATWEIYAQAAESTLPHAGRIRVAVAQWWATKGVLAVSRELFGENEGGHATPSEISVAMYAHPECDWRAERVPAGMVPAAMPRALGAGTVDFQRAWPDGRIESDPTRARPEHGRRLVAAAVADLAETWRQVLG